MAAVFHDGVEDDALLTGLFISEEPPVFGSQLGRADRVFDEIVANFHPAVAETGIEVGPLILETANDHEWKRIKL